MSDPFEHKRVTKKDPKARLKDLSPDKREAYCAFRALLWKAIDEKDEDFSIVETSKALGYK